MSDINTEEREILEFLDKINAEFDDYMESEEEFSSEDDLWWRMAMAGSEVDPAILQLEEDLLVKNYLEEGEGLLDIAVVNSSSKEKVVRHSAVYLAIVALQRLADAYVIVERLEKVGISNILDILTDELVSLDDRKNFKNILDYLACLNKQGIMNSVDLKSDLENIRLFYIKISEKN